MDRDGLLTLGVALCCLVAVGMAATTLETAVDTDPSEVVNPDYSSLPIDSEDAEELREQIEGGMSELSTDSAADEQAESDASDAQQQRDSAADRSESQQQQQQQQQQQDSASTADTHDPSLLDRLLSLLEDLLQLLLRAVPLVLLAVALALAVGYRDRLIAALRDRFGAVPAATDGGSDPGVDPPTPSNEVASAWLAMISHARLDGEQARTPRECAQTAVEAGIDPGLVAGITETFENVRYGGEPVTEERKRRARQWLARLRSDEGERDEEGDK